MRGAAFEIDQSRVDAPNFPRSLDWWTQFMPMWVNVSEQPGGSILLTVDSPSRARSLHSWLATCARGRLSAAFRQVEPPESIPRSRWDVWLDTWRANCRPRPPVRGRDITGTRSNGKE